MSNGGTQQRQAELRSLAMMRKTYHLVRYRVYPSRQV